MSDHTLSAPRWARWLVGKVAGGELADEVVGDLEEAHRERVVRRGWILASLLTGLEALDVSMALMKHRWQGRGGRNASYGRTRTGIVAPGSRRFPVVSWIDVKLGLRMLAKYPGMSAVSVIGMAVAIAIGAGGFEFLHSMTDTELPLADDDRIVALQNDTQDPGHQERQALNDFVLWRGELRSVRDLSAFVDTERNLVTPDGGVHLVRVAAMSAAGFRVARVDPFLGRALLDEDEEPGAAPVVVIGYDEWLRRFHGDAAIIGREVQLGAVPHTVVGVMPEGYHFPLNHRYWVPLELNASTLKTGEGPEAYIFGRLADGATLESANAELATIGLRHAAAFPETHEHLRPRVVRYAKTFLGEADAPGMAMMFLGFKIALSLLVVVVAVNVGVLVYARTAARTGEIAVRTALGASRRRVVGQLFIEALVMSGIAAAIGLTLAATALGLVVSFQQRASSQSLAYWVDLGLSLPTIFYTAGLAVLAGVIVGVLPALKATGRGVHDGLKELSARGSQMQLGRMWTALIVVQVAITVAAMPFAAVLAAQSLQATVDRPVYAADELLQAMLTIDQEQVSTADDTMAARALDTRFHNRSRELLRRLEAEPGVSAVTIAGAFPGDERFSYLEVEELDEKHGVGVALVEPGYFADIGVPVLAGREFAATDSLAGANRVVVDRNFVEQILGGGDAFGRRIRMLTPRTGGEPGEFDAGPWHEVVGVVSAFVGAPPLAGSQPTTPRIYLTAPLPQSSASTVAISIRLPGQGAPARFATRLREITAGVDPDLKLIDLGTAAAAERQTREAGLAIAVVIVGLVSSVILLSAAGIYAMMSFTVARRRREIGIRAALGASPRRLLSGVFARAGRQLGLGVFAGLIVALLLDRVMPSGPLADHGLLVVPAVVVFILAVGMLAALGPARRGLAVQPTEALRSE